jgi:hypothetical protein
MTTNLFDLEQEILSCWHVTDDINVLFENVMDRENMSMDEISNYLLGLKTIYDLKFQKCFNTFEKVTEERRIENLAKKDIGEKNDGNISWNPSVSL